MAAEEIRRAHRFMRRPLPGRHPRPRTPAPSAQAARTPSPPPDDDDVRGARPASTACAPRTNARVARSRGRRRSCCAPASSCAVRCAAASSPYRPPLRRRGPGPLAHRAVGARSASTTGAARPSASITLAGDTAQRLFLDNGFRDWRTVLDDLGLSPRRHRAPAHRLPLDARDPGRRPRTPWAPWPTPSRPSAPRSGAPVEAPPLPRHRRGGRLPRRGPARRWPRASPAPRWPSSPATPSRPTLLRRPAAGRGPACAASAPRTSPSAPASRSPTSAR